MRLKTLSLFALLLMIIACGGKKDHSQDAVFKIDNQLRVIDSLENKMDPNKGLDANLAQKLIYEYMRFSDSFPQHDKAVDFIMKRSDLHYALREFRQQAQALRDVIQKYPDYAKIDVCYYMLAHILDSEFDERSEAKKFYEQLVEKFPRSVFISDAESRLQSIDSLTFNQLIDQITRNIDNSQP